MFFFRLSQLVTLNTFLPQFSGQIGSSFLHPKLATSFKSFSPCQQIRPLPRDGFFQNERRRRRRKKTEKLGRRKLLPPKKPLRQQQQQLLDLLSRRHFSPIFRKRAQRSENFKNFSLKFFSNLKGKVCDLNNLATLEDVFPSLRGTRDSHKSVEKHASSS